MIGFLISKECLSITIFALFIGVFPCVGTAQQNLFNVPSSEITKKNKFFFQQQFNIGALAGNSNTTIDYGLGDNIEVGINLFNLDLYPTNSSIHNPHFLVNFQKAFELTKNYKISLGTQTGFTPPIYHQDIAIPSFSYLNNAIDLDRWGKYYLGAYYANLAYAGPGDSFGVMAGAEIPLIEDKVHLMGDLMTGKNDIGVAVVGLVFYLPSDWQLSFGAQLPAPGSNNDYGMVFEITKL
jgi:hypothetical protein